MTDTVSTNTISVAKRQYCVQLLNTSDGTGETSVVTKIDISTLTMSPDLGVPTNLTYLWMEWNVQGFTSVTLLADHNSADVVVARLSGSGYKDWTDVGGFTPAVGTGTGDLLLLTVGGGAASTYDITVCVRLED